MSKLDLSDIQGIIVRGYRMPMVRYFLLKVENPAAARAVLGRLANGDNDDGLQITTADEWHVATPGPGDDPESSPKRKPDYCLNVGITWPGLVALGVQDRLPPIPTGSFDAFVEGAAKRAERVGDHGDSGPEHWVGGFGTGNDHVMMALYALSPEAMETYSGRLTAFFQHGNAFEELWHVDGAVMTEMVDGKPVPVPKVHFGYTDGITVTPRIRGGPEPVPPDHQQACEPWLFILSDDADNYPLPKSFRTLAQRQLWGLQNDGAGRCRLRELPSIEQRPHRSGIAGSQDLRPLAQRRSSGAFPGYGFPSGGHHPGRTE